MRPRHKILAVTLVALLFASIAFNSFVSQAGWTGNLENLPWYAGSQQGYSYVITTNSSSSFAFNGTTNLCEISSTNASYVWNSAIGNCSVGGKILVKTGTYTMTSPVLLSTKVTLEGEKRSGTAGYGVIVDAHLATSDYVFEIPDSVTRVVVSGMGIYGDASYANTGLMLVNMTSFTEIFDVDFKQYYPNAPCMVLDNADGNLLEIHDNYISGQNVANGIYIISGDHLRIHDNQFMYMLQYAINQTETASTSGILYSEIISNHFGYGFNTTGSMVYLSTTTGQQIDLKVDNNKFELSFSPASHLDSYTGKILYLYAGDGSSVEVKGNTIEYMDDHEHTDFSTWINITSDTTQSVADVDDWIMCGNTHISPFPLMHFAKIAVNLSNYRGSSDMPYSMMVWTDGTNYYSRNGTSGEVQSTTSANTTFNNVASDLVQGGSIFVKAGQYANVSLNLLFRDSYNSQIVIKGEGVNVTKIQGGTDVTSVISSNTTAWNPGGFYRYRTVILEDLSIHTTGYETYGLNLPYVSVFLRNIMVIGNLSNTGADQHQVYLGGSAPPDYPSIIDGVDIVSDPTTTNASAVMLESWLQGLQINQLTLHIYGNMTYSWRLRGLSTHVSKLNVYLHGTSSDTITVSGAVVYCLGTSGYERHIFDYIWMENDTSTKPGSYFLKVASDYTGVVQINSFYAHLTAVTICADAKTSASSIFTGYGFENYGNEATCINGTAIAHGLLGMPTSVSLTMYGQNYINSTCWYLDPSVYSMNATHVVICFTIFNAGTITAVAAPNSRTLYWIVAYQP